MPRGRPRKTQSTAMTQWREDVARRAALAETSRINNQSLLLSTQGGVFTYKGVTLEAPINIVVLDEIVEKSYYINDWDPDNPQTPACYAYSPSVSSQDGHVVIEGMAPHEKSSEPQSDECSTCRWNQFGTGKREGKACADRRRLLIVPANEIDKDEQDFAHLKIPPSGLKKWDAYVRLLSRVEKILPEYCITSMDLKKLRETDTYAVPDPQFNCVLPDDIAMTIPKIQSENQDLLLQPFFENESPPKKKRGRKPRGR